MFKLFSYFKDDRKKFIFISACILIIIYTIVKIFMAYSEKSNLYNNNSSSNSSTTAVAENIVTNLNTNINNNTQNTNNNVLQNTSTSSTNTINEFIKYCINNNIDNAYNMLTDDCKNIIFNNNKQEFLNEYIKIFFNKNISYQITDYVKSDDIYEVYRVTFFEDPLTTGNTNKSESKLDYITVVNINGSYKLNVLNFIKKDTLNANKKDNYIELTVLDRLVYVDYEIYNINVKNNILVDIILDDMTTNIKTYIQDKENNKFKIKNDEYTSEMLRVSNGKQINISLKFDRKFLSSNEKIKKLVFSRINVINRMYNKEITDTINNIVTYEEQLTTYPTILSFEIDF